MPRPSNAGRLWTTAGRCAAPAGRTTETPLLARGQGRAKGGVTLKSTGTLCGHCDAPVNDGYLCTTGVHDLREALARLTDTVRRADREPVTTVMFASDGTTMNVIIPGDFGRRTNDPWSLPSGQTVNLPGELRTAAARQARFSGGVRAVHRDGEDRPLPIVINKDDRTGGDRERDLRQTVARWSAVLLAAGRPAPPSWTTSGLAAWMETQLPWIRLQEWSTKMLDDIRATNDRAMRAVDRPADRLYLGTCGQQLQGEACRSELLASPGDSVVRCPGCGTSVSVAVRRSELMEAALGMWLSAGEIERLSAALAGDQAQLRVKRTTVAMWHQRGAIVGDRPYTPRDESNPLPPARFLLRDVLAMAERPRRSKRPIAA